MPVDPPLGIVDPLERASKALLLMEESRSRLEQLAQIRARAVHEVYLHHGGAKAARLLGISRVTLYRIIGQIPEVHEQRVKTRTDLLSSLAEAIAATDSANQSGSSRSTQIGTRPIGSTRTNVVRKGGD